MKYTSKSFTEQCLFILQWS